MFNGEFNLALGIFSATIGWASMAFFGVDGRLMDQRSRLWIVVYKLVSAMGGLIGGWVYTQLPLESTLPSLIIASFSGSLVLSDIYNFVTRQPMTSGPWSTSGPWGREGPGMLPNDPRFFIDREQPGKPIDREQSDKPYTDRPGSM